MGLLMEIDKYSFEKTVMVLTSISVGFLIFLAQIVSLNVEFGKTGYEIIWGRITLYKIGFSILSSFAYPIVGAIVIRFCEFLRLWATKGEYYKWEGDLRLFFGALWPITLTFSLIIYSFLGIINRIF